MGHHEDGNRVLLVVAEFLEQRHDLFAAGDVEVAGWFVGKQHGAVARDGSSDGDTLLLTARKLVRNEVHAVAQTHLFEGVVSRCFGFAR